MGRKTERRLAAILALDVVGYSQLMGQNETGTLAQLKAHRRELIDPKLNDFDGRIVKEIGDGLLVEFHSAVDAVECAIEIQRAMMQRNAEVPKDRRILFRAGINLGDVIVDEDDLFGDGVNIAARIEALAEPGGVCISASIYEQIRNKLYLTFGDLGDKTVKNIAEPVHVYEVSLMPEARPAGAASKNNQAPGVASHPPARSVRKFVLMAAVGGIALGAIVATVLVVPSTDQTPVPRTEQSDSTSATHVADRPSIAVLPFDNMSGDKEQEYFSDGITEDLITDLSQISGLTVIARNSVFTYKGRAVKVEDIARDLGVRYVLEGSVRKAGDRVRINAQLIDGSDGSHMWAERFDRDLKNVFALQDEVTEKIVSVLAVKLTMQEQERLVQKVEANPEAYDILLRGLQLFRRFTRETNIEGRELFKHAIALDPEYARAYANVALSYSLDVAFGWSASPDDDMRQALFYADQAFALDAAVRQVPFARSTVFMRQGRLEEALVEINKAINLDPNYADAYARMGEALVFSGRADEGKHAIEKAMRLNPHHSFMYKWFLGKALFTLEQYEEAAENLEYATERNPEFPGAHLVLAATYGQLGKIREAEWEAGEALTLLPSLTLAGERTRATYQNAADLERYIDGLRKAGLSE